MTPDSLLSCCSYDFLNDSEQPKQINRHFDATIEIPELFEVEVTLMLSKHQRTSTSKITKNKYIVQLLVIGHVRYI